MNRTLTALMIKLSEQLNNTQDQLDKIKEQIQSLQQELQITQEKVQAACTLSGSIQPEQEIARLNFIIQNQQQIDVLVLQKKTLEAHYLQNQERQVRLNSELKMLQHYQEKQQKSTEQKIALSQQQAIDEWVLQKRSK